MSRNILIIILITIVSLYLYFQEITNWAPKRESKSGGKFVEVCNQINNQPFTFENIAKLNGFIDLNGKVKPSEEDIKSFLEKQSTLQDNDYYKKLRIYKDSWFKGPNTKYSWICELKRNRESNTINSNAGFYITD